MTFNEWYKNHRETKRYDIFGHEENYSDAYYAWKAAEAQYQNWYLIKYRYRYATPSHATTPIPAEIRETCITIQSNANDVAEAARTTLDAIMREKGVAWFSVYDIKRLK